MIDQLANFIQIITADLPLDTLITFAIILGFLALIKILLGPMSKKLDLILAKINEVCKKDAGFPSNDRDRYIQGMQKDITNLLCKIEEVLTAAREDLATMVNTEEGVEERVDEVFEKILQMSEKMAELNGYVSAKLEK